MALGRIVSQARSLSRNYSKLQLRDDVESEPELHGSGRSPRDVDLMALGPSVTIANRSGMSGSVADELGVRSQAKAGPNWHFLSRGITICFCVALSFFAGRASKGTDEVVDVSRVFSARHAIQYSKIIQTKVSPFEYLATFSTQLRLENHSKKGDGWAPWQLAVSGDAHLREEFCVSGLNLEKKNCAKKTSAWVQFNSDDGSHETGVWGLYIDPEQELERNEAYFDEEIIETRFQVTLTNELSEPTLMHFHGFTPPNNLDGIPWLSANPIQPNATVFYDFVLYHRGFYWMHSHFRDHAGSGLFAPIIIKDGPKFSESIGNPRDVLMIIVDNHWRAACAYARHLHPDACPIGGFDSWKQYTFNVNGHSLQGRKPKAAHVNVTKGEKIRLRILDAGMMAMYRVSLAGLKGIVISKDGRRVKANEKPITSFPLTSANRLDVLVTIPADGEGCYPIAAVRAYPTDIQNAERGVLILKTPHGQCNASAYAPYEKNVPRMRSEEIVTFHTSSEALNGLMDPHRYPDVHHVVQLTGKFQKASGEWRPDYHFNNTMYRVWPYMVWCKVPECNKTAGCAPHESVEKTVLREEFCQNDYIISNVRCDKFKCGPGQEKQSDVNGRCFNGTTVTDDAWKNVSVRDCNLWQLRPARFMYNSNALPVCHGDRVWITFLDEGTQEPHPIHMHGMHQQLIGINGKRVTGPLQDTWFAFNMNFTVAFDALNPGEWLLHCHYEHHLMNGMATTVKYVMDGRCRERLDFDRHALWHATPPLPESEWPESWHTLWDKQKIHIGLITLPEQTTTTVASATSDAPLATSPKGVTVAAAATPANATETTTHHPDR